MTDWKRACGLITAMTAAAGCAASDGEPIASVQQQLVACPFLISGWNTQLQGTPGGRDIWALVEAKVPGLVISRPDVGGTSGGLQGVFSARGTTSAQNTSFLNGVNVGDPAAIDIDTSSDDALGRHRIGRGGRQRRDIHGFHP